MSQRAKINKKLDGDCTILVIWLDNDQTKYHEIRFKKSEMIICDDFPFTKNETRQLFNFIKQKCWNKKEVNNEI